MYVGSPLGSEEYVQRMLTEWLEDLEKDIHKIMKITNNQVKFIILRYCITARLTYFLRTIPFTYFRNGNFFEKYDEILKTLLADITQVDPDAIGEINMMIAKLHCIDGGVGLCYQEDRAVPAYVASYTAALETITATFPSIQILIDRKLSGELSDNEFIPPRLQAYFDGIEELAALDVKIDNQVISLQLLMSQESKTQGTTKNTVQTRENSEEKGSNRPSHRQGRSKTYTNLCQRSRMGSKRILRHYTKM